MGVAECHGNGLVPYQFLHCAKIHTSHDERTAPSIAPMVRDEEIERTAVQAVIAYEEARG